MQNKNKKYAKNEEYLPEFVFLKKAFKKPGTDILLSGKKTQFS